MEGLTHPNAIHFIITYMKLHIWNCIYEINNVIGQCNCSPFHWKPLVKQWNGWCFISLKTLRETMKWKPHRCCSFHWNSLGKQWNGILVGTSQFHWKPLGKQWNGRINTSQCHQCISSLHIWNYIYEITYMKSIM